jgi:hypothetical protein
MLSKKLALIFLVLVHLNLVKATDPEQMINDAIAACLENPDSAKCQKAQATAKKLEESAKSDLDKKTDKVCGEQPDSKDCAKLRSQQQAEIKTQTNKLSGLVKGIVEMGDELDNANPEQKAKSEKKQEAEAEYNKALDGVDERCTKDKLESVSCQSAQKRLKQAEEKLSQLNK